MSMKVYQPRYQVRLIKTVNRKTVDGMAPANLRFQGTNGIANLVRWLGDGSSMISPRSGFHLPAGRWT